MSTQPFNSDGGFNTAGNISTSNVVVTASHANLVLGDATPSGSPGLSSTNSFNLTTDRDGNAYSWTFSNNGTLTTPGTTVNITGANVVEANTVTATTVTANTFSSLGNLQLLAGEAVWSLLDNGQTIFPTLAVDLHNGGSQNGQTLQFGDANQQAFITGPAPATDVNAQRLIIQGQRGLGTGEGGDVYIWGGDSDANGGDIKIYAGDADTDGIGGNIHIAGGQGTTGAGEITLIGGRNLGTVGAYVGIQGGQGNTGGGNANITGGYTSTGDGGNVNITGGGSGSGPGGYGNINISSASGTWTFDNNGNLNLPNTGVVYETNIPFGGLSGKTIALKPYGGTSADQQLLVYPTAGADANHLHLTSGNLYNTELFLGNDDLYVKLANTGNIVINSNDGGGNTAQWIFDTTGNLTTPGSSGNISGINTLFAPADLTIQTPSGVPATVTAITGSSGSWESNPTSDLATTGGTGTGLTVDVSQEGGYAGAIAIHTPGTGYSDGDAITVVSGSSSASFTISVVPNNWTLDTAGNLTVAGSIIMPSNSSLIGSGASPAPNISGFSSISADNFRLMSGNIIGGESTVVTDGINSIQLALGAQMDVFGFPFSGSGVRGQLTITDVTTPAEANGTWYYQAVGTNAYQIYTDSTYSTPVDASGWSAYTGGGNVAITKQTPSANIVINSNGYFSTFDNNGTLNLPGDVNMTGTGSDFNMTGGSINGPVGVIITPTSYANLITPAAGARAFINDGNKVAAGNFGAVIGDGGSNLVPVWSDGVDWYIG